MKILGRAMIYVGFTAFLIGISGMDSPSLIAPSLIGLGGLAMLYAGGKIEDAWT